MFSYDEEESFFFSLTLLTKQNVKLSIYLHEYRLWKHISFRVLYVSDYLLQLLDAGIDNNDDRNHDS